MYGTQYTYNIAFLCLDGVRCLPASQSHEMGSRWFTSLLYVLILCFAFEQHKYISIRILYFLIYFSAGVLLSYNIVRASHTRVSPGRFQ